MTLIKLKKQREGLWILQSQYIKLKLVWEKGEKVSVQVKNTFFTVEDSDRQKQHILKKGTCHCKFSLQHHILPSCMKSAEYKDAFLGNQ